MNMTKQKRAQGILRRVKRTAWLVILGTGLCFTGGSAEAFYAAGTAGEEGLLEKAASAREDLVTVELVGVAEYELTEMFHHVLRSIPGVIEARRMRLRIEPAEPQACFVTWQVRLEDTDLLALESALFARIQRAAGRGEAVDWSGMGFKPHEVDLRTFGRIRPWQASSREIRFVQYRPPVDWSGRTQDMHAPQALWPEGGRGFE